MLAIFLTAAIASAVPSYDIDKACKSADEISQSTDHSSSRGCVQDELEAKDKLTKEWHGYSAIARQGCASVQTGDRTNSYVELVTCFEMQDWVKNLGKRLP